MFKKNLIIVTGGCGFVGKNLIEYLLKKTNLKILSLDNYSSGSRSNHIDDSRVTYLKGHTKDIVKHLSKYKMKINCIFHFGEFSRIYQSFLQMNKCIQSNSIGSNAVFDFSLKNNIRLIYSATSASLGNNGEDKNLSPYAFTKAKNLELLENLKKWYDFKFEVIYFYNVYGPRQISKGEMATVIGIFEDQYKNKRPLTVVRPGSQSRRFTHVNDTIDICFYGWKKNRCSHYSISNKKSYTVKQVAQMFKSKIKFLPARKGERFASALSASYMNNKTSNFFGEINLKDYIKKIIENRS